MKRGHKQQRRPYRHADDDRQLCVAPLVQSEEVVSDEQRPGNCRTDEGRYPDRIRRMKTKVSRSIVLERRTFDAA